MSSIVSSLMDSILTKLNQPSVDIEVKKEARKELRTVRGHARLMSQKDGYKEFLLEYVQREHERFKTTDPEADGFDAKRTKPLCGCPNMGCDLKKGRVPLMIRDAETMSKGIRRFEQEHNGRPVVLHDAKNEYTERSTTVEDTLVAVNISLTHNVKLSEMDDTEVPA